MMYSIPLYFRATQGSSNTVAGSHLFPAVLGNTTGGLLVGLTIQKTGRYKALTILATISSSLTYCLLILRWHGKTSWLESLEIIPGGLGTGMAYAATFIALTSSVKKEEIALVTGGMYLASAVGMVVGIAVSSAVQLNSLQALLLASLHGPESSKVSASSPFICYTNCVYAKVIEQVISDVGSIRGLDEGIRKVVIGCYVKSLEHSHSKYL
jgi:MFS family permease